MSLPEHLTLEELKKLSVESVLHSVSLEHHRLIVHLPDGHEVLIQPKPHLKPLPVLKSRTQPGWKEAIYHESE